MAYKQPDELNRAPGVEILPDQRQRITRTLNLLVESVKQPTAAGLQPGLSAYLLAWGTADSVYTQLRLVSQNFTGSWDYNKDPKAPTSLPPTLTRVYETISETAETQVGNADIEFGPDGLALITLHYLQFSGQTPNYETVGTATCPTVGFNACILKDEKRTDDGTLQRIDRLYSGLGVINTDTQTKYNGSLSIQTITSVGTIPSTPSGYVLVGLSEQNVNGLTVYTATFAKGSGQISQQVEYRLSPDGGTTGVTVTTIKYLSAPGAGNPITAPSGSTLISIEDDQSDGYIIWTGIYAQGQGTISTTTEIREAGNLILTTITAINAAPSAPAPQIGGTPTLYRKDQRNGTRFEDGTIIYEYVWAEANGSVSITKRSEPDGAIVYEVAIATNTDPVAPPPNPALPTVAYCETWTTSYEDGYYVSRASWKVLPPTKAYRKQIAFEMPGQLEPTSPDPGFVYVGPVRQELLGTVTVSFSTTQVTTAPFSVLQYASLNYYYVRSDTGATVSGQQALNGYLSGGTSTSGTGSYNGVPVSSWTEVISGSTPSAPPSGSTTITVDNEPYLTDIFGTQVFRSVVTTYTFP